MRLPHDARAHSFRLIASLGAFTRCDRDAFDSLTYSMADRWVPFNCRSIFVLFLLSVLLMSYINRYYFVAIKGDVL